MLDAHCAFKAVKDPDIDIYWGAYVGTKDEILVSGRALEVADQIDARRGRRRARKGWIMDIYLLRRSKRE